MRTNVYLTVDTEHSMGGAWTDATLHPVPTERHIFCRIAGKDYGIGWLCEELGKRNFRATFFAEMFASLVFGKEDTRAWCQYLLQRGQDVQLHTHLNYYYYAEQRSPHTDDLADLPSHRRSELLERACELFYYATGSRPTAFRAGNWRATRDLLPNLANAGICLDSSYNPAARSRGSFPGERLKLNALQKIDGVWELPQTVARQSLPEQHLISRLRPLNPVSLSSWEINKTLDQAYRMGLSHIVVILHSSSGVKAKDDQYREMKPDRVVLGRVRSLLDHLANNPGKFRVTTCSELVAELVEAPIGREGVPELGFIHPLARKVVQAVNSIYWV